MASTNLQQHEPKVSFADKLSNFVNRRQIIIWAVLVLIIVSIVLYFVFVERNKRLTEASTVLAEESEDLYGKWLNETDKTKKAELESKLLDKIKLVLREYPHLYGAQRVLFIRGNFYYEKKNWQKAASDFIYLANAFPKSYLARISLFNAASCNEEMGNLEKAIELYKELVNRYSDSALFSRSLFSIGRIYEEMGKYQEAKKFYNELEDKSPSSSWTKIARNRIIYLKVSGKIKEEE